MHVFDILKYAAIGFNRYMVECEWRNFEFRCSWILCFNRYMVECELYSTIKDS